jgi:hypothetical protein
MAERIDLDGVASPTLYLFIPWLHCPLPSVARKGKPEWATRIKEGSILSSYAVFGAACPFTDEWRRRAAAVRRRPLERSLSPFCAAPPFGPHIHSSILGRGGKWDAEGEEKDKTTATRPISDHGLWQLVAVGDGLADCF